MAYLDRDDYLEQAKALERGRERRIEHFCGEGTVLKIAHTKDGYSAYCFRCSETGFTPHVRQTLSQFDFLQQREEEDAIHATMALPSDFTTDIPQDHALWLYKAGIGVLDINRLGFGYSERLSRVVLPVYDNGELVYLQARATRFPEQQPKYLNIAGANKSGILYTQKPEVPLLCNSVVLTEDILSAARIGEITTAFSLLGTKLSDGQANKIGVYDTVIFWLDGDDAGIKGARKGSQKLQFLVNTIKVIRTPLDPKCYSQRLIRKILNGEAGYDYYI